MIQTLLDAGTDPNAREKDGKTPLHDASNPAVIQALLDAGADADAEGQLRQELLCTGGRTDLAALQALLDAGASPKAKSNNGSTPLHWVGGE